VQTVSKLLENWALKGCTIALVDGNHEDSKCDELTITRDDIEKLLSDADKGEKLAGALVRIGRIDCARLLRSVHSVNASQTGSQPSSDDDLSEVIVKQ